jgi:hypothetical protein
LDNVLHSAQHPAALPLHRFHDPAEFPFNFPLSECALIRHQFQGEGQAAFAGREALPFKHIEEFHTPEELTRRRANDILHIPRGPVRIQNEREIPTNTRKPWNRPVSPLNVTRKRLTIHLSDQNLLLNTQRLEQISSHRAEVAHPTSVSFNG